MSLTGEQHISKTINLLRFPLMLLVVCMHFSGGGDNTTLLYCNLMQFGLIYFSTAVPIYFAISGYLFWKGNDLFQYKNKIQKRVYSGFNRRFYNSDFRYSHSRHDSGSRG